jgi:hypothetical protein
MTRKVKVESGLLTGLLLMSGMLWFVYRFPTGVSARSANLAIGSYKPMGVENSEIHWERLSEAQREEYKTTRRDIFAVELPPIPVPEPFHAPEPGDQDYTPPPPPPPPPPPKLSLKFFGYGTVPEASGRRAFLADGENVYVVAEGDTVLGHYRIVKINHISLEFEEIASGRHGTAALEDPGPNF